MNHDFVRFRVLHKKRNTFGFTVRVLFAFMIVKETNWRKKSRECINNHVIRGVRALETFPNSYQLLDYVFFVLELRANNS